MEKVEREINELEAWKLMMDSMVKFIEASTKVMNTFTEKASSQLKLPIISSCEIQSMLGPALSALNYSKKKHTRASRSGSAPERENPEKLSDGEYEHKGRRAIKSHASRPFKEKEENSKPQTENTKKTEEVPEGNGEDDNKCSMTFDNITSLLENEIILISDNKTHLAHEHLQTTKDDSRSTDYCYPVEELDKHTQYDLTENQKKFTESITQLMALKLEEAQKEIDYLKNELVKIQSVKNVNESALYIDYDKTPKSSNSTRIENMVCLGKPTPPSRSLISPTESCRQSPAKFQHQSTVTQRRSIPLRMRPRITNEMVYIRNNMQQKRRMQSSTGYEQPPKEMYNPNYQQYQRQMYPTFTRPPSTEAETYFNLPCSTMDPGYTYQIGQSVYHTCEGTDHFRHRKSENYLSVSDEASGEEYLCDSELF